MKIEKLCIITGRYPTEEYPINTFLDQLVCQFADMGIKCTVIAPYSPLVDKLKKNNYHPPKHWVKTTKAGNDIDIFCPTMPPVMGKRIGKINFHKLYCKLFSKTVKKTYRENGMDADVIYAHFIVPSGMAAAELARAENKPYFIAYGESSINNVFQTYDSDTARNMLKDITGCVSVSTKNKNDLIENKLIPEERISVFPNAIDTSTFYTMDRKTVRKELGFDEKAFIVAFVGHFIDRKGPLRLSEAIDKLGGVNSFFIGDGEQKPTCEGILHMGRLPHNEVVKYLNAADVFVLPTLAEGCCNAIVEAMACGLPVISSDLSFNDDILDDTNSIRIDPRNIDEIAKNILLLKNDEGRRHVMAEQALLKVKSLSLPQRAEAIYAFMTKLLEQKYVHE